jgi:FkbM family methyltransferase
MKLASLLLATLFSSSFAAVPPPVQCSSANVPVLSVHRRLEKNAELLGRSVTTKRDEFKVTRIRLLDYVITVAEGHKISWTADHVARDINRGEYNLRQFKIANNGRGATMLDLASNVGMTAVLVAKMYPQIRIVGIEASPTNWAAAQYNLVANGVADRVTIYHAGLSSDGCPITFYESVKNPGASSAVLDFFERGSHWQWAGNFSYEVQSITVSELLELSGLRVSNDSSAAVSTHIPLIKFDCEGCEYTVLPSLSEPIAALFRTALLFGEVHADRMTVPPATQSLVHGFYDGYDCCPRPGKMWPPKHGRTRLPRGVKLN